MSKMRPIFIFCLPRSGSTLLQRILMNHSEISSVAEPHFLLPLVFASKKKGILTKYSHLSSHKGINDVIENLPNKHTDFNKYINEFSMNIYNSLSEKESKYFLDKTPRYFWIIPDIIKIFPNAKFIFLFRNPIQIYASLLTTFCNNRFNKLYMFYNSLFEGVKLLSEGYVENSEKSICINYENLINNPEKSIKDLLTYLDLEFENEILDSFHEQKIKGKSVDPTGIKDYKKIAVQPLKKWEKVFNTRLRKRKLKEYINSMEEETLSIQGYEKSNLFKSIENLKTDGNHSILRDILDYFMLKNILKFKLNLFFGKNENWTKNQYLN